MIWPLNRHLHIPQALQNGCLRRRNQLIYPVPPHLAQLASLAPAHGITSISKNEDIPSNTIPLTVLLKAVFKLCLNLLQYCKKSAMRGLNGTERTAIIIMSEFAVLTKRRKKRFNDDESCMKYRGGNFSEKPRFLQNILDIFDDFNYMDMKLYISDIREHLDLCGTELLEEERRIRLYRYRRPEDRARCLTAGLMLRSVLGRDAAACITLSRFGKPFLPDGPRFNLSHSGEKVVLLVDTQTVGVDVERIDAAPLAVAKKVFTAGEQKWLWHQAKDEAFFRLWTGKEAIMKALGLGLQLPPESFAIHPDSDSSNVVCGYDWYLHWLEIDGHMICTAAGRSEAPQNPVLLTKSELLHK